MIEGWGGNAPGMESVPLPAAADPGRGAALVAGAKGLAEAFAKKHPSEKALQVSLEPELPQQDLVHIMDGALPVIPDLVLLSYEEAMSP